MFLSRPRDAPLIGLHLRVIVTTLMEAVEPPGKGQAHTRKLQLIHGRVSVRHRAYLITHFRESQLAPYHDVWFKVI